MSGSLLLSASVSELAVVIILPLPPPVTLEPSTGCVSLLSDLPYASDPALSPRPLLSAVPAALSTVEGIPMATNTLSWASCTPMWSAMERVTKADTPSPLESTVLTDGKAVSPMLLVMDVSSAAML